MFNDIPAPVLLTMQELEKTDGEDRVDGTPRLQRLRQIPPETGRFICLLAASSPEGSWIEIGTSAGYSTLWLTLACRERSQTITTFEIMASKSRLAQTTFTDAGVKDVVNLVQDDFLTYVDRLGEIGFCFLDAEKEVYQACYEAVVPRLVLGGLLVADNAISHQDDLSPMLHAALDDPRVDAMVVPIGKGELVCRKR
jgi:predicted O-methyltransferase YrrM